MAHRESRNSILDDGGLGGGQTADPKIQSMEALLRRAQALQGAIQALSREMAASNVLLPFPAMQTRLSNIQAEMNQCKQAMDEHKDVLSTLVMLPTPQFPAKYQQAILDAIFKTRMEPRVVEWQDRLANMAADKDDKQDREKREGRMTSLPDKDRQELWNEAAIISDQEVRKHAWFQADYTYEEVDSGIEHVRHGLKRDLKVPEREPDEDEDDDFDDIIEDDGAAPDDRMDVDASKTASLQQNATKNQPSEIFNPPMPIDSVLRFMTTGQQVAVNG